MTLDKARRKQLLARWHRRIGISVAAWLILLAISGLLINHAHDWGLDQSSIPGLLQELLYPLTMGDEFEEAALISWERLMLDLHAARFLGPLALWFSDLMAGLLLLLSISGIWIWWRQAKRK
ncbi:MAG: PepSY domain-containing protein [Proteobacteria bacterium]|nr:PepSY domain-containing protein [Pseudomonadota bacterium]